MKKVKRSTKYFEIISWGIVVLIYSLLGIKFPSVLSLTTVLSIFPIVIITTKYKEVTATFLCLITLAITAFIFPIPQVLIQGIVYLLVGVSIGYCLRGKFSLEQTIAVGSVAYIIVYMLIYLINLNFWKVNIIETTFINNIMNVLGDASTSLSQLKIDNISLDKVFVQFNDKVGQLIFTVFEILALIIFVGSYKINVLFYVIPGIITLMTLVMSYFTIVFSVITLKKIKYDVSNVEPFAYFRLPAGFGLLFIVVQLILWSSNFEQGDISKIQQILLNAGLILNFSFFAQGLALIDFWVSRLGISGIFKTIIYTIGSVVLFPFVIIVSMILMIAGMLDYVMDLRKLETK